MRIAIAGANGFLGRALTAGLRGAGHDVVPVVRRRAEGMGEVVEWDPAAARLDAGGLEGMDAVVNLAGENVAGRWTAAKKRRIRESRVRSTAFLSDRLARLSRPPATFASVSAIGIYGAHAPEESIDESSPPGTGFLAAVAREWEAATASAEGAGIRVVHLRMGVVLGHGGTVAVMLPLFQIGLGGSIGSGDQVVSWIALDEITPAVQHVLATPQLSGPVNFTAPGAVSFRELAAALASALKRPALFRVPSFAARLAMGEMADEMILSGARVVPRKLLESGYQFRVEEVGEAMRRAVKARNG